MAATRRNTKEAVRLMLVKPTRQQHQQNGEYVSLAEMVRQCGLKLIDGKVHSCI